MKKTLFHIGPALTALIVGLASCQKEPVILNEIQATFNGYSVSFSVEVKYVDTYFWDFGDDKTSSDPAPVHEYEISGIYTVNLTVSGRGGEVSATKQIEIVPSATEMLTGGPVAANGKTWVLSPGYTAGMDGASAVDNSMMILLPSVANVLDLIGLGEEYDNEFTFYSDGRYKVDVKNGIAPTSAIYGTVNGNIVNYGNESNSLGVYGATYTAPASSTWTLHEEDLVVDAIINPLGTEVPAPHENRTITGKKWISLSEGAFFGIVDFPTTRKFIVKEISPDTLNVAVFICGYSADPGAWTIPSHLFHLTYIPKK